MIGFIFLKALIPNFFLKDLFSSNKFIFLLASFAELSFVTNPVLLLIIKSKAPPVPLDTIIGNLNEDVESDVLVCSDHSKATEKTSELLTKIPGIRPLDAGGLSNATAIEAFSAVILQLNSRYKTRAALRFIGIEEN